MSFIKKESGYPAVRIKTEPGGRTHASASGKGKRFRALKREKLELKDGEVFNEDKKSKTRKRKADSSPECYDYKDVKIGRHECSIKTVFRIKARKGPKPIIKALKKGSCHYDEPDPEMKIFFHELDLKKSPFFDNIVMSTKLDETLKLPLRPDESEPRLKIVERPCTSKDYPWKNDICNPSIAAVDRCIREVVQSVLLDQNCYKKLLMDVLHDLNEAVKFEGYTNRWNWFGSYLSGLVCLDSNFNLCFECIPENENCDSVPENMLKKVAVFIKAYEGQNIFRNFKFNPCIRFPLIKILCKGSLREIEITFSTELNSGEMLVANSSLMKLYLDMSQTLMNITVFVRIILQRYCIHGTPVKFQTNTVFWLVVFFMQRKKLLPAVIDVRKAANEKYNISGWDCSLPEKYSYPTEPVSLYSLLLGFFEFYKNFDFLNYVICPYVGRVFHLSDFEQLRLPTAEFSQYLAQVKNPRQLTFFRNVINLQDPSDLCCNIAQCIDPENVSKFNIVCHRMIERFPNSIEKIDGTMGCLCKILTNDNDFYDYSPFNMTQYAEFILRTQYLNFDETREKKLNHKYIVEAIRKMMESIFKFQKKSILNLTNERVTKTTNTELNRVTVVQQTFPVIYFEYCSSECTWDNVFIKGIYSFVEGVYPRKTSVKEQIKIFITCEVCLENNFVRILVQGDVSFVEFLSRLLLKLLKFILEEIVP